PRALYLDQSGARLVQPAQETVDFLSARGRHRTWWLGDGLRRRDDGIDVGTGIGSSRRRPGSGQPTVAHDVNLPPALGLAAPGRYEVGQRGHGGMPLGSRSRADERVEPVPVLRGILVALLIGQC